MISKIELSIVTPSYNQASYIEDAIRSVMNQSYPYCEHIIVDGGSTDGTIEILKDYPHLRWISEPDNGQSHALNKGFNMAKGNLIGWLNADDYFLPAAFNKVIDCYAKHNDVDVIYGDYFWVNQNGQIEKRQRIINYSRFITTYYGPYIPTSGSFFSRAIFDECILLDETLHYQMDRDLFIRLGLRGKKFKKINEVLSSFRFHKRNKSLQWKYLYGAERARIRNDQLAEGKNILDKYGIKLFRNNEHNELVFRFLFKVARVMFVLSKTLRGYYFQQ